MKEEPPPLEPARAIGAVERLTGQLAGGSDVSRVDLDGALVPLRSPALEGWPDVDLQRLLTALAGLKRALVARYRISDENGLCTEDSWVSYADCEPGYACLARVEVGELRCLWWLSGR
jgi:hypothetical protein